ncbi:MAG: MFS transporter [Spirochaetaceae bacterium]|nr:MFS transporter [Spirochaetaceae bacterium]
MDSIIKDRQYYKFCAYGFLRNLRFFEAFLVLYLIEKEFSFTNIGILYAIREVSANLLEIPSGIAADVLGRKKTLASSFLAYILSFLIFYFFDDFPLFTVGFFLFGVGEAFRSGTHKGMIADYLKRGPGKDQMIEYYGHTRSWSQKGLALSSIAAGLIVFYSGNYKGIFLFSTIPYVFNFVLVLSYPSFLDKDSRKKKLKKRHQLKAVLSDSVSTLKSRHVLNLLNISALHTAYLKAMKDYIQPMIFSLVILLPFLTSYSEEKRSSIFIGFVYFCIFLMTSRASIYAGKLAESRTKNIPALTLLGGLSAGVFSGLLYLLNIPIGAVLFFIIIYLVENLRKPILTGYISHNVDNSILTSVLSVQSLMKTVLTAIIALVFGIAADFYGIGMALVLVSSILIVFTLFIGIISRNTEVEL